jgi:hypothetical protein
MMNNPQEAELGLILNWNYFAKRREASIIARVPI